MNVELHPAAQREIDDAQSWYEERSTLAASAFLQELSIAIQRIRQTPERYPAADAGTRRILLERFPFTIYYRVKSGTLTVVSLAHQKRRPGYWSSR
jgi:plasmid stabilization system protein ParE